MPGTWVLFISSWTAPSIAVTAWATAYELPNGRLSLDCSLAHVAIVSDADPDRADRVAARWLQRVVIELPGKA